MLRNAILLLGTACAMHRSTAAPPVSGARIPIFKRRPRPLATSFKINCAGDAAGEYISDFYQWTKGASSSYHATHIDVAESATLPSVLFRSHRHGLSRRPWSYELPIETAGVYHCALHFAETYAPYQKPGARVFSVTATGNAGTKTEHDIDVHKETDGDTTKSVSKHFVVSAGRAIKFSFEATAGEAFVSAIECDLIR